MSHGNAPSARPRLDRLDMSARLDAAAYERRLAELQHRLRLVQQAYLRSGRSAVIVFEGWDAAGKGGTIRRISSALDPRSFKVWPIGPPRPYYRERHYLTRFVERLPPWGAITVFDRSWYGRVLVERVEGLVPERRWRAAYGEIRDFERMLVEDGTRLVKLFLHIGPEEQLARFEKRLRDPMKRWKLSPEDFRNRARRADYAAAIEEMFQRTSRRRAPWHPVAAEDKKHGRIAAIGEIVRRLSRGVDLSPPAPDEAVLREAGAHLELPAALTRDRAGRAGG